MADSAEGPSTACSSRIVMQNNETTSMMGTSSVEDTDLENNRLKNHHLHVIEAFRPTLRSLLQPSQLVSLMAAILDRPTMGEIYFKEHQESRQSAADYFLDELVKGQKKGWFACFINALKEKRYDPLVKCLEGEDDVEDHEIYYEIMNVFSVHFDKVDPMPLLPKLLSKGCIINEEVEAISTVHERNPALARFIFTDAVMRHHMDWFPILLETLKACGLKEIVEAVIPGLQKGFQADLKEHVKRTITVNTRKRNQDDDYESDPKKMATLGDLDESMEDEDTSDCVMVCEGTYREEADNPKLLKSESNYATPGNNSATHSSGSKQQTKMEDAITMNNLDRPEQSSTVTDIHMARKEKPAAAEYHADNSNIRATKPKVVATAEDTDSSDEESSEERNIPSGQPQGGVAEPIVPQALELRSYQMELAEKALEGKNVIVVAPTGSGKTHVAMKIAKVRFETADIEQDTKVLFIVPTAALVEQQTRQFKIFLNDQITRGISGDTAQVPFGDLVDSCDIIVVTPQIVTNAIKWEEIASVRRFCLIILDECHHTDKEHPYAMLMMNYLCEKQKSPHGLPQIVGMTASVGVGKAKSEVGAQAHILRLCARLDSDEIGMVTRNKLELMRHSKRPDEDSEEVRGRAYDPFKDIVSELMRQIEQRMLSDPELQTTPELKEFASKYMNPPRSGDPQAYTNWIGNLKKPIAQIYDQKLRRVLSQCYKYLDVFNRGLTLNDDCEMRDALDLTDKLIQDIKIVDTDATAVWLRNCYSEIKPRLDVLITDDRYNQNPKLNKVKEMVRQHMEDNPDLRAMLFCKTRDTARAICNWMKRDRHLSFLQPDCVVGARASADKSGMTQNEQDVIIRKFEKGDCKMLVATSVAEEGLDIEKCDRVFRYESVTNEIAMVQTRGRVRRGNAKYVIIGGEGRGTIEKEDVNRMRERLMNRALQSILEFPAIVYKHKTEEYQLGLLNEWHAANMRSKLKLSPHRPREDDYQLRCFNCNQFACYMNDVGVFRETFHVVTDVDFLERIHTELHPRRRLVGKDTTAQNKLYCRVCKHDWGIEVLFQKTLLSVIKIVSFVVADDEKNQTYKKWKDVPTGLVDLSDSDIHRYGIQRSAMEEEMRKAQEEGQ